MKTRLRMVLAIGSVAIFVIVNAAAIALGPSGPRVVLLLSGLAAVGFAVQSARWNRPALTSALLFSLPSIVGLVAENPPIWLVGLLGTALLMAAELNASSWSLRDGGPTEALARRDLLHIGQLGMIGLAGSLALGAPGLGPSLPGTAAVLLAATAIAALGWVLFGRRI
ncbi:MAG: hypothetical protein GEU90_21920 [Gemmatimonas sp.]|nr:hypothetical protein [Gemmatimonas sp.]